MSEGVEKFTDAHWRAVLAHLSPECEPRGTLPNANTMMMEIVRLRNMVLDTRKDRRLLRQIVQTAYAGGSEGKVFLRDDCMQQAVKRVQEKPSDTVRPTLFWDDDGEIGYHDPGDLMNDHGLEHTDFMAVRCALEMGQKYLAWKAIGIDGDDIEVEPVVCDTKEEASVVYENSLEQLRMK